MKFLYIGETMNFILKHVIEQINFGTLATLFCLMGVVAGFTDLGYLDALAGTIVKKSKNLGSLLLNMVMITFFMSMFVTNDVGLIIMVPFTIQVLHNINRNDKLIKTVVLETIGANLGSMLTPIGNPQNVFLYHFYHMNLGLFVKTIGPYAVISFVLLYAILVLDRQKKDTVELKDYSKRGQRHFEKKKKTINTVVYSLLFVVCLLAVLGIIKDWMMFVVVSIGLLACNFKLFRQINYGLLLKFVLLFILVGNLADCSLIADRLVKLVSGHEVWMGIALSQVLSNVPAAIMLSNFTKDGAALMLGVDIGGLGTLIASMASMISLEFYGKAQAAEKKKYIVQFTGYNIFFLIVMCLVYVVIAVL